MIGTIILHNIIKRTLL